jgi:hypothetical protein
MPASGGVRGGKAEVAPEPRPVHDPAAHGIRPAEQALGAPEIARLQGRAHRGAGDALPVEQHIGHRLQGKTVPGRRLSQHPVVARAPRAEAKVASDEQPAHAQAPHQHLLHKAGGRKRGEGRIEAGHVDVLHARGSHQLQLVAQPREPRGSRRPGKELARMRLEGQHAGGDVQLARLGAHTLDQRAMAAVHAVEVADRQGAARAGARRIAVRHDHG